MDSLKARTIFWENFWKIPGTTWSIRGYSRAAFRTGFYIPELKLMLDAGCQNFNKPNYILITHTHTDHIACLPFTLIGDEKGDHVFHIMGPVKAEPFVRDYISHSFAANACERVDTSSWFSYRGVRCGDQVKITTKKTELEIEVFECDHTIPAVGYGITELRKKLHPSYQGLSGKEIGILRKSGVEVTQTVRYKRLAYICDTSIDVFKNNPGILEYKAIFIECTFFRANEQENALKTKHIHWETLRPFVLCHPNKFFVLFHFSLRYKDEEIVDFFKDYPNVMCWT